MRNSEVMTGLDILEELEMELAQVSDDQVAFRATKFDKVEKGETVVGTVTNEALKKLWCLMAILGARGVKGKADIETATSESEEKDKLSAAARDMCLAKIAKFLFWAQLRREFDIFAADNIGVRSNWQVITSKDKDQHPLAGLLGGLLGGGSDD